jgi:hypothetical protein
MDSFAAMLLNIRSRGIHLLYPKFIESESVIWLR